MKTDRKFRIYNAKKKDFKAIVLGGSLFLLLMPYFMWENQNLIFIVNIVLVVLSISYFDKRQVLLKNIILLPILFFLILYKEIESNFFGLLISLIPLVFFLIREEKIILIYKYFKLFFAVSILLSLVVFIAKMLSIPINYNIIEPLNPLKTYNYYQYPFLVTPSSINLENILGSFRFFGMFDEPGVIGTFCGIMLVLDKYKMNSFSNKILLLGGLASVSFFFMGITIAFMLYFSNNKKRLIIFAAIAFFFFQTKDNSIVYGMVWERFEVLDGEVKGDNRANADFLKYYNSYLKSDDIYFGKGKSFEEKIGLEGSASYKQLVFRYGIIFTFMLILFYIAYSIFTIKKMKGIIIFILLFLALLYNRPFIFSSVYTFIIISSITIIKEKMLSNNLGRLNDN
jgi:hypothetical protein